MASPLQGMKPFTCRTLKLLQCKKCLSPSIYRHVSTLEEQDADEFRVFDVYQHKRQRDRADMQRRFTPREEEIRADKMKTDQIWTNVWPAPATFKASVVPFPVRQGYPKKTYHMIPKKYANTELLKIPNFLHLTPNHIKKHCAAIKKFCNPWPSELDTNTVQQHFPIEVITHNYVTSAPTSRNPKAREVTVKVKLSELHLDYHAKDKLRRLVGDRYDEETDILTIKTDRCPVKKQNEDYAMYLLTAIYFESWTTEPWESEKEESDWERHFWDKTKSRENIVALLQKLRNIDVESGSGVDLANVNYLPIDPSEADILESQEVKKYKEALTDLHDEGENENTLEHYKASVLGLLSLTKL